MRLLDNYPKIKHYDKGHVLDSIELLPDQIEQSWEETSKIKFPADFMKVERVILAGMGGSALGARLIQSFDDQILKCPLWVVNDYYLPEFADSKTLVILASYSGNTEETISCFIQAQKKNCPMIVFTTGGKLSVLAQRNKVPNYIFQPRYNPSSQPRLGTGYSIGFLLALLNNLKLVEIDKDQLVRVIEYLKVQREEWGVKTFWERNSAKQLATSLAQKIVVLISANHLNGAAHIVKNMLNESAKTLAVKFELPEANHHLLEGLEYPQENRKVLKFLFLESDFYSERIKQRLAITKEVVKENRVDLVGYKLKANTRLGQALELTMFGGYLSFYLASLYGEDPSLIPWVDYFKEQLAKK